MIFNALQDKGKLVIKQNLKKFTTPKRISIALKQIRMLKNTSLKSLNKLSSLFIILSAISLGLEANFSSRQKYEVVFTALDLIFLAYFTIEIFIRFQLKTYTWTDYLSAVKKMLQRKKYQDQITEENAIVIEEWTWMIFDMVLIVLSYLSFFRHIVEHPQLILLLRLFRVFRIFRLFELNSTLKEIEKRIISTVPTIITFLFLILIILYSYALIGMYLYDFRKLGTIDFSSVYNTMVGLFITMTNGWSSTLTELYSVQEVPRFFSEMYIISFFVFSVLITLNVFLAVMTSQVQEKLKNELQLIKKGEDDIQKDIRDLETENIKDSAVLHEKIDKILDMLSKNNPKQ